MSHKSIRTRFAPSPTGLMHLGNIRTALFNYLFARQNNGIFILRIEDTDPKRNFDPGAEKIIHNLQWLGLDYDYGPSKSLKDESYLQSERTELYHQTLTSLAQKEQIYRCFCTESTLEKKRSRQITLKQPPRYDRECLKKKHDEIARLLQKNTPFVWRLKLDSSRTITINDLGRKIITFDLKNFSDFPLTRQDGTPTFMFANCIDDIDMNITHVFRGNDHLSNTAGQAALYQMLNKQLPTYWHMPILCNIEGKKLSKRDFGFSLYDLKNAGFLPEAITNYLAIIGGGSFEQEILSLNELSSAIQIQETNSADRVKYDVEKLRWVNHKWINQYPPLELSSIATPFLSDQYPALKDISSEKLATILQVVKTDVHTLDEFDNEIAFYFIQPKVTIADLQAHITDEHIKSICTIILQYAHEKNDCSIDDIIKDIKLSGKKHSIPMKEIMKTIRIALTGKPNGLSINELTTILEKQETIKRLLSVTYAISAVS